MALSVYLPVMLQMPLAEKVRRSDLVIDNSGSMEELVDKVSLSWSPHHVLSITAHLSSSMV